MADGILITVLVLMLLMAGSLAYIYYYITKIYPIILKSSIKSGAMHFSKKNLKLEKKINEDLKELVINEAPEILEQLPNSFEYAEKNNMIPQLTGQLGGKLIWLILSYLGKSPSNPESVKFVTELAQKTGAGEQAANTALQLLSKFFGRRKETGEPKLKEKTITKKEKDPLPQYPYK